MATIEDFILKIKVQGAEAVKGLSGGINTLKKDVEGFAPSGGAFSNTISGITGKLGGFATAGLGAAAVVVGLGMRAIELADALQDISDATGISAGSLNNFKNSLIDAGGKADDFSAFATRLTKNLGEAAIGNEAAQKSFEKLGVFVRDANGNIRDSGTVLQEVIGKLAGISDPAIRSAMAVALLGKEAAKIDFTKVNAINDPFKDAQIAQLAKYRGAIDALVARINDGLITAFGSLFLKMEEASKKAASIEEEYNKKGMVGPRTTAIGTGIVTMPAREMNKKEKEAYELQLKLKEAYKDRAREMSKLESMGKTGTGDFGAESDARKKAREESEKRIAVSAEEIKKFEALKGANDLMAIEENAKSDIAKAAIEIRAKENLSKEQMEKEIAAKTAEIQNKAALESAKYRMQQNAKIFSEQEAQRQKAAEEVAAEETRINNIIESSKQVTAEQQFQLEAQQRKNKLLTDNLGKSDREKANATAIAALEDERATQLKKISEIKDLPYADRLAREKELNAEIEKRKELTIKNQEIDIKNSEDFDKAWETAYKNYIDNSKNASEQASQLFKTFTSSFEDNLTKSFAKGKLMWREFLLDMVQQLIRSNIQSLLGTLFGGKSNSGTSSLGGILKGLAGFANGGMIPTNSPVIVGERGPEILMGAAGRTVIPNSGIGGSNVTYNINAVDAMSFKAMVASDPTFLYAVTEQGRRRLPGGMK